MAAQSKLPWVSRRLPVLFAFFAGQALGVLLISLDGEAALLNLAYDLFGFIVLCEVAWLWELRTLHKALAAASSPTSVPPGATQ